MENNLKICVECNIFLNEIYHFVAKTRIIDAMFLEIEQIENHQQQHPEVQEDFLIRDELPQLQACVVPQTQPKESDYEKNINSIRQKFGLKPLEMPVENLNSLFDESNITGALEIKMESDLGEFDTTDALSEDHEYSESSEEEDDSEIEELSDSQLRKHDELLQFRDESSDSEQEERKKHKKKYRKSDEEKLFEWVFSSISNLQIL